MNLCVDKELFFGVYERKYRKEHECNEGSSLYSGVYERKYNRLS